VVSRCEWCGGEIEEDDMVVCGGSGVVRLRCGRCVYDRCVRDDGCEGVERVCEFVVRCEGERVVVGESERKWVVCSERWWVWGVSWVRVWVRSVREWVWWRWWKLKLR